MFFRRSGEALNFRLKIIQEEHLILFRFEFDLKIYVEAVWNLKLMQHAIRPKPQSTMMDESVSNFMVLFNFSRAYVPCIMSTNY